MNKNGIINLFSIAIILILLTGCAVAPGDQKAIKGIFLLSLSLIIIFFTFVFWLMKKNTERFFVVSGFFVGLLCGLAIIFSVPIEIQYVVLGGLLGMSADWAATFKEPTGAKTAINSLAIFVSQTVNALRNAAIKTKIKPSSTRNVSIFLWTLVLSILVMLLMARALGPIYFAFI